MTAPADEWSSLIERTASGDEAALARLYDTTVNWVHGLALRILGDRQAAEEVTSDVYLQVWRQATRYDPARGAPLAWLMTMTRSRAIDRARQTHPERAPVSLAHAQTVPSDRTGPEEGVALIERQRLVQTMLSTLPAEQRQTIELAYFRGLSQSDIATIMDAPLGTVKTRIRLGMERLRFALGTPGGSPGGSPGRTAT